MQRDSESGSPPAAMTSQNYLQLLHNAETPPVATRGIEKLTSSSSRPGSYENTTMTTMQTDMSAFNGDSDYTQGGLSSNIPELPKKTGQRHNLKTDAIAVQCKSKDDSVQNGILGMDEMQGWEAKMNGTIGYTNGDSMNHGNISLEALSESTFSRKPQPCKNDDFNPEFMDSRQTS